MIGLRQFVVLANNLCRMAKYTSVLVKVQISKFLVVLKADSLHLGYKMYIQFIDLDKRKLSFFVIVMSAWVENTINMYLLYCIVCLIVATKTTRLSRNNKTRRYILLFQHCDVLIIGCDVHLDLDMRIDFYLLLSANENFQIVVVHVHIVASWYMQNQLQQSRLNIGI